MNGEDLCELIERRFYNVESCQIQGRPHQKGKKTLDIVTSNVTADEILNYIRSLDGSHRIVETPEETIEEQTSKYLNLSHENLVDCIAKNYDEIILILGKEEKAMPEKKPVVPESKNAEAENPFIALGKMFADLAGGKDSALSFITKQNATNERQDEELAALRAIIYGVEAEDKKPAVAGLKDSLESIKTEAGTSVLVIVEAAKKQLLEQNKEIELLKTMLSVKINKVDDCEEKVARIEKHLASLPIYPMKQEEQAKPK